MEGYRKKHKIVEMTKAATSTKTMSTKKKTQPWVSKQSKAAERVVCGVVAYSDCGGAIPVSLTGD